MTDDTQHKLPGVCPHCGFAMNRDLDSVCPRCKQDPNAAPKLGAPAPPPVSGTGPGLRRKQPDARPWLFGIGGASVLAALLTITVCLVVRYVNSPTYKAGRSYQEGLLCHDRGDFEGAKAAYQKALELDPTRGAAAFVAGVATLRVSDKTAAAQEFDNLVEQAKWGDTQVFAAADLWMQDAVARCDRDPKRPSGDSTLGNNTRVKAWAQLYMCMTALLRFAAAAEAKQMNDAEQWLDVADRHLRDAEATDPTHPETKKIRAQVDKINAKLAPINQVRHRF